MLDNYRCPGKAQDWTKAGPQKAQAEQSSAVRRVYTTRYAARFFRRSAALLIMAFRMACRLSND
eukprot:scaffold148020_cov20-Prasinocladus_malaysianus.AAC.1